MEASHVDALMYYCAKKCIVFFHSEAEGRKRAGEGGIDWNGGTAAVYSNTAPIMLEMKVRDLWRL